MSRCRTVAILAGAATAAVALVRHGRGAVAARTVAGGILIGDTAVYDTISRLLLGSFFRGIAANIATVAPAGARVLEVGCGPGRLSIRLARHGFDVVALDLDPAMIERARANAAHGVGVGVGDDEGRPTFVVGDAGSLPFPDGSFDLVVSTLLSSARCRCTTGATRGQLWQRSAGCSARMGGLSSGTSGPALGRTSSVLVMATRRIKPGSSMARRFD